MATLVLLAAIGTTHAAEPKKKGNEVKVAPSFAWTASEPLGLHFPATIDTLFEQYHHRFIPVDDEGRSSSTGIGIIDETAGPRRATMAHQDKTKSSWTARSQATFSWKTP